MSWKGKVRATGRSHCDTARSCLSAAANTELGVAESLRPCFARSGASVLLPGAAATVPTFARMYAK